MLNVRGREQYEEFAFSRDKMGSSCKLYRLFLLDCVGSWVFWGKVVLLAQVAQKYSCSLKQPVFIVAREEGQELVR